MNNDELYKMAGFPNISERIRTKRLRGADPVDESAPERRWKILENCGSGSYIYISL